MSPLSCSSPKLRVTWVYPFSGYKSLFQDFLKIIFLLEIHISLTFPLGEKKIRKIKNPGEKSSSSVAWQRVLELRISLR